ncbi:MAG: glycosyltransferase family 25 protein [Candidatus Portiera sp.]|nr:glycosyltransferase family 25 protein [Portiera sp.]
MELGDFPTYVISLPRATERRDAIAKKLQGINLPYEIIDATDEREGLTEAEIELIGGKSSLSKYKGRLMPGALGCLISHLRCYEKLLSSDSQYALILEDDAKFSPAFMPILNSILARFPNRGFLKNWHLINLGGWPGDEPRPFIGKDTYPLNLMTRQVIKPSISIEPKYYLGNIMAGVYGTHCYIISRAGCSFSLKKCPSMYSPIDYLMNDSGMPGLFLVTPQIAYQRAGEGDIGFSKNPPKIKHKINEGNLEPEKSKKKNTLSIGLLHWLKRLKATCFILILCKPSSYYKRLLANLLD